MQKLMIRRSLIYLSTKLKNQINSGCINGVKFLLKRYPKNRLALTNSSSQKDGYGAQIQRILSVLALSNEYGLKFILKPISFAEDQITQTPLGKLEKLEELGRINNWLQIRLDPWRTKQETDVRVRKVRGVPQLFFHLILNYLSTQILSKSLIIEIEDCYEFTNIDPDMYTRLQHLIPQIKIADSTKSELEIHVHLRYANFAEGTERYLDSNYYIKALMEITTDLLHRGQAYNIFIHSDFNDFENNAEGNVYQVSRETLAYLDNLNLLDDGIKPNQIALELARQTQKILVRTFRNVHICKDEHLLTAIARMTQADYLVLSKSSFAFISGLMNTSGRIYTPEYWNNPPSKWIKVFKID